MKPSHIVRHRLVSQHIAGTMLTSAPALVGWMGAMQAQDYAMAKWAVGVRVPGATEANVEAALNAGEILRTHVLRPTWHLVAAEDIYWMLALTAPHIIASQKARHAELELTPAVLKKTYRLLEKTLRDGNYQTREELNGVFERAKISIE
ncbi:MAG: winged helix DNA-binding domain-containing protein, partial [Blastocatellia bacterium]|nr:winged helix DNA-binding domain-containing protein [Blastocatellia bacterium]